jgi:hypothetical protein
MPAGKKHPHLHRSRHNQYCPLTTIRLGPLHHAAKRNPRPGYIPGTSQHDLPENNENPRDLSRRSEHMIGTSTLVRNIGAPDPAYRPTRVVQLHGGLTHQLLI